MLRVLANENIPGPVIKALQIQGHDVVWVRDVMPGGTDVAILAKAQAEGRLVITFDKDFGELAFRYGLPAACGVVLFRLSGALPQQDNERVVIVLNSREDWQGHFATVSNTRIRIRPLPLAIGSESPSDQGRRDET